MLRALFGIAFSAALLLTSVPHAKAEMLTGRDVDKILAIAQSFGTAELTPDSENRPLIRGQMEGVSYLILFYGCRNGKDCTNIQFGAAWEPGPASQRDQDVALANQWNTEKRFGNAYVDTDGAVIIKMEVNMEYGVERRTMEDTFDWWRIAVQEFPKFFFK